MEAKYPLPALWLVLSVAPFNIPSGCFFSFVKGVASLTFFAASSKIPIEPATSSI